MELFPFCWSFLHISNILHYNYHLLKIELRRKIAVCNNVLIVSKFSLFLAHIYQVVLVKQRVMKKRKLRLNSHVDQKCK